MPFLIQRVTRGVANQACTVVRMEPNGTHTGIQEPSLSFLPEDVLPASRPDVPGGPGDVNCEVLVIGAGVAGLTAANEVLKRDPGTQICVVEAKERVGGRTLAVQMQVKGGGKETFDLGGQWVGTPQTDIMETLDELGLEVYRQYTKGSTQLQLDGPRVRRLGSVPNIGSWWGTFQLTRFVKKVDKLAGRISPDSPHRDRTIRELQGFTAEAYARRYLSSGPAFELASAICRGEYGIEPCRVSLVEYLVDVQGSGGMSGMVAAQEFKVKGGTQQISELLADRIGRQRLYMQHPVTSITQREDGIITVNTAAGTTFHCKYVISAIPPNQLNWVQFDPPLNPVKQEIVGSMHMGHITKFIITFEKAFWREAGLSGEGLSSGGGGLSPIPDMGPVTAVADATSHRDSPALVGFIAGNDSIYWQSKTKAERENAVIAHLVQFFGEEINQYIEYQEKVWSEETYIGGGPGCCTVPGLTALYPALRERHGNVLFCGADFSTRWLGFLSGAVYTGRQMALESLYGLRPASLSAADLELIGKRAR